MNNLNSPAKHESIRLLGFARLVKSKPYPGASFFARRLFSNRLSSWDCVLEELYLLRAAAAAAKASQR